MTGVAITGAGLVLRTAQSPSVLHAALCENGDGPGHVSTFPTVGLPCQMGSTVDPVVLDQALAGRTLPSIDKPGRLAIVAAQRAMASGNLAADGHDDVGLVLGTMFSGARTISAFDRRAQTAGPEYASPLDFANTVLNAAAGQAAIRLSLRGVNATIAGGYTSGLQAIAYASDLIAAGRATTLLAGGVEEVFAESFVGFCRAGVMCGTNGRPGHVSVPFDASRTGFALGEGAGFLVLERDLVAASRGAVVQGCIAGYASATDPDAIGRGYCGREAIAAAVQGAMSRAGVTTTDIDAISASANGSYDADCEEGAALADVFGSRAMLPAVTAIKAVTGELLGAAGPLQIIAMLEAMRQRCLPGIRGLRDVAGCPLMRALSDAPRFLDIRAALVLAVSPEGSCCAMVIQSPEGSS